MVEPSYGVSPTAGQPRRLFIWPHYTVQGGALQWSGEARQIQKIPAVANSREEKYKGNTAQFPPCGLSTAPAAAARHLRCQNAR